MTSAIPEQHLAPLRGPVTVHRRVRPRAHVELARLTRYRGGTYSHTVDTVTFVDGTSARTDLIRLNPGVEAYSLDFSGVSPTTPSRYEVDTFSAVPNLQARAYEIEIDWILRNSVPQLRVAELSRRLRDAGYPLGRANISEHEAIAGTQAAIWNLTNGLQLDNRPRNEPARIRRSAAGVTAEFDDEPELGGYTFEIASSQPVTVTLEKSDDGRTWRRVAGSRVTVDGSGSHRKALGIGATASARRHGRAAQGHRFYRLTVDGPATIGDIGFWLTGTGTYRNADRIVHLYNYLLDGARRARAHSAAPALDAGGAHVAAGLVGPFRLSATSAASLNSADADIVDPDGRPLDGPGEPGSVFFLRPRPGSRRTASVSMTVPGAGDGYGGRVLTGVAREVAAHRYTPVALAVPTQLVVDFDIQW